MHVRGLKLSVKSLGWLLGLICFGLVILYPPIPGLPFYLGSPLDRVFFDWHDDFSYILATGGLVWHVVSYLHLRAIADTSWMGRRALFVEFAPYCFLPITLSISVFTLWHRVVDYAVRPAVWRGVLSALLALIVSLVLVFLLDWVGGRILLYTLNISRASNIEIRGLISEIWMTAVIQSALLALPCLVIGGLLARRQKYLESKPGLARQNIHVISQA